MFRFVFAVYLLLYFRFAQGDVLSYLQSVVCGHYVAPMPWFSSIAMTFILLIVEWGCERLLRNKPSLVRLPYVLMAWLATSITSLTFVSITYQVMLLVIACVVGILVVLINKKACSTHQKNFWQYFYPASMQMLLLCFYVGVGNGVTDLEHYELQTAQALQSTHPKRGYKVGDKSFATSHRLFAMRCYLLATTHKKGLGDKVFEQMVPAHGNAECLLLPTDAKQQLLFPAAAQAHLLGSARRLNEPALHYLQRCAWLSAFKSGEKPSAAIDYYLTALLLDRKLETFAREVVRYYPRETQKGKLPTYFAQALVLYQHSCLQPVTSYSDNSIEANYQDYGEMGDRISNPLVRNNMLRNSYGETYWWWYTYAK